MVFKGGDVHCWPAQRASYGTLDRRKIAEFNIESSLPDSESCEVEVLLSHIFAVSEYVDYTAALGSGPLEMQIILSDLNNTTTQFQMPLQFQRVSTSLDGMKTKPCSRG